MRAKDYPFMLLQIINGYTTDDLPSAADWESLIRQAQADGVAPLLYWNLSKTGKLAQIPDFAGNALRESYAATWMNNQQILQELGTISKVFHEAGIPIVLLKGVCFALTIYPDIGLRPMGDLDILVPKTKLAQGVQLAQKLGYVEAVPDASPGLNELIGHHACLRKTGEQGSLLEIHDSLVAEQAFSFAVSMDWFWEQTQPLAHEIFHHLQMLSPTAQVLFAAAHAMLQHGQQNSPLRWFYDIDLLIRSYNEAIDWEMLIQQARFFEWGSALKSALERSVELFETPIPQAVREQLQLLSDRHENLVAQKQNKPATHTLLELQKMNTLSGYARLQFFMGLLAPTPAYMRWRYGLKNNRSLPAWYVYRWAGILKDAILTIVVVVKNIVMGMRDSNQTQKRD